MARLGWPKISFLFRKQQFISNIFIQSENKNFFFLLFSSPYLNTSSTSEKIRQHDAWRGSSLDQAKRIKALVWRIHLPSRLAWSELLINLLQSTVRNWDIWDDISIWWWCCCVENWVVIHIVSCLSLSRFEASAIMCVRPVRDFSWSCFCASFPCFQTYNF